MKPASSMFGQLIVMLVAIALCILVAFVGVKMAQSLIHGGSADEFLLKAFEAFLGMLLLGTLVLVFMGTLLRFSVPSRFAAEPFGTEQLHELYDKLRLDHFSVESDRDHVANPYRDLPDLELCDVAKQVDEETYPDVWNDVAHEIKTRVEQKEPLRIG